MSANCTNYIEANPDVAGIGIRISFYITTILGALVPRVDQTAELQSALSTSAGLNGLALLITAIVETSKKQLSLYHALVILHMLTFLGVTTNPSGNYRVTSLRMVLIAITTWSALATFISWSIYVWVRAPTFGSQPECNHATIYVFFFRNVRATIGWLRWILVAGLAIGSISLTVTPIAMVVYYIVARSSDPEDFITPAEIGEHMKNTNTESKGVVARVVAAVYGTVMLELMVKRNDRIVQPGENEWSFGQFVALLVALGGVNEVIHFILSPVEKEKEPKERPVQSDPSYLSRLLSLIWRRGRAKAAPTESTNDASAHSSTAQPRDGLTADAQIELSSVRTSRVSGSTAVEHMV